MTRAMMRKLGAFIAYALVSNVAAWYHAPLILAVSLCLATCYFVSMCRDYTSLL
jgi:hypothetical protein